jgi:2-amino-4-hydroxy-6-hydroxymethyldihydropteridine diphosphokinase
MDKMERAYISAGSNMGDRKANLEFALDSLAGRGIVSNASSCYETEPVGFLDQPWFLNQVIEFETGLDPLELLSFCNGIEASRGRIRTFPNAPRILDLDILLYAELVISWERLIIPHPRMTERRFVLKPLAEIAPDLVHPVLKKSMRSLLHDCRDLSVVRLAVSETTKAP